MIPFKICFMQQMCIQKQLFQNLFSIGSRPYWLHGVIYLSNYRIQCHSLLRLGLWLVAWPVKPQKPDFLSPVQKTIIKSTKNSNNILFCVWFRL